MDLKVLPTRVSVVGELDAAIAAIAKQHPDALLDSRRPALSLECAQDRRAGASAISCRWRATNSELVEAGGLFSYGASIADSYRRAAAYVDKILKGAEARRSARSNSPRSSIS